MSEGQKLTSGRPSSQISFLMPMTTSEFKSTYRLESLSKANMGWAGGVAQLVEWLPSIARLSGFNQSPHQAWWGKPGILQF